MGRTLEQNNKYFSLSNIEDLFVQNRNLKWQNNKNQQKRHTYISIQRRKAIGKNLRVSSNTRANNPPSPPIWTQRPPTCQTQPFPPSKRPRTIGENKGSRRTSGRNHSPWHLLLARSDFDLDPIHSTAERNGSLLFLTNSRPYDCP